MLVMDKGDTVRTDWKTWEGGLRPVGGDVMVQYKMRDGDRSIAEAGRLEWTQYNHDSDIVAYRVHRPEEQPTAVVSDGGSSDYYKLTIKNKAGETLQCEMGDIIRAVVANDFDLGNVLKAARRMSLAKQGSGKAGTTVTYDANKIKYFAEEFAFWHEVI